MDGNYSENHSAHPVECPLCQRFLPPDNDATQEAENVNICGDCKFLFFEDLETSNPEFGWRRPSRGRRTRNSSFDSVDELFSQQFSHMITLVRQNQSTLSGQDDSEVNASSLTSSVVHSSSNTTPIGSRRWHRVSSDTESDGFDVFDSLHGESESNVSLDQFRVAHTLHSGYADTVSFSAYGGDSNASIDGRSFTDIDMHIHPDDRSSLDSDTDIDPMHAGLDQWNSDELEEDGGEDDNGWEEADEEEIAVETAEARHQYPNFYFSSPSESNGPVNRWRRFHSPEYDDIIGLRIRERRNIYSRNFLPSLEDSESRRYVGNSGDYLDGRGFDELLEHLAESDNSRRGPPPAAVSVLNSLPLVVISEKLGRPDDLVCAICKDVLFIGTEVNQLPCFHLYHPSCILPWLNTRNSCPLCRYELPTDDKDYEEGKHNFSARSDNHEIEQEPIDNYSSSDVSDGGGADGTRQAITGQQQVLDENFATNNSGRQSARGRWFLSAAAPIVSLVGIALAVWFGHSLAREQGEAAVGAQFQHFAAASNQSGSRRRRWWYIF